MPTSPNYCSGSGKSFTSSGYWSHLTQSQNPSCQAILEQQLIRVCSDSDNSSSSGNDIRLTPADNLDNDFGQMDDGIESTGSDDEADKDQRAMNHELEMSWKPSRVGESGSGVPDDSEDSDSGSDSDLDYTFCCFSTEQRVHECTAHIVRYSSKYPSSRAGAVVSFAGQTVDDCYSSSLGSRGNSWTPFTSKIDWEVAFWAKMRGPGSTAFSDLLAINGVGDIFLVGRSC